PSSSSVAARILQISTVGAPPVKSNYLKTSRRTLIRKRRRTWRRSLIGGGADDGEDDGFFGNGNDVGGPFGGGDGGGWNFDRFGWSNWDESSSFFDPAFDFVYEVISWIALSNCLHFALKKVLRILADGMGDQARETPVC
ncbi:uncharacterized protein LOC114317247, partial [Camellia sinensis]|uniref:uncharacterized protein LOC114317247 n=1 Tax=Camellia sinensis TaxID=4442 RepID=UPI001036F1FD